MIHNINNSEIVEQESNNFSEDITPESILNTKSLSLSIIENTINVNKVGIPSGVSEFQINNFSLSKREFPNDYAQFLQAKDEIYLRVNTILNHFYQYKKSEIEITLFEGKIEKIQIEENYPKIRDAEIALQKLEIEKNKYVMDSIKNEINKKLRELDIFYKVYSKHKHFETDPEDIIKEKEEEYWRIKSAYYGELQQKYNLTPNGFVPYPHEEGFKKFIERINRNTNLLSTINDNDNNTDNSKFKQTK